jgi:2-phosphoglycerate kinase
VIEPERPLPKHVVVTDQEYGLPYSKGLTAASIMATGLAPARAFRVAELVEERLRDNGIDRIDELELTCLTLAVLQEEIGGRYAESYAKWQQARSLKQPLVILLGGATGVGKSTIATMLASRLGITRVIPTDAIREVMRAMFSPDLLPTLQRSSFEAGEGARHPLPADADPTIAGFGEQTSALAVGIEALIARACDERTHMILEGAHIVPGFLDLDRFAGRAVVVPIVVTVDDAEVHRSHFVARGQEVIGRPPARYLEHFDEIRTIHRFVRSMALRHGVPLVSSYSLDATLSQVIDLVVTAAMEALPEQTEPALRAPAPAGAARSSTSNETRYP